MLGVLWVGNWGPMGTSMGQDLGSGACTHPGRAFWRQWCLGGGGWLCTGAVGLVEGSVTGLFPSRPAPQWKLFLLLPNPVWKPPYEDLKRGLWLEPSLTLFSPVVSRPGASQDRGQPRHSRLLQPLPPWTLQYPLEMPPLQPPAVCGLWSLGGCWEGEGESR